MLLRKVTVAFGVLLAGAAALVGCSGGTPLTDIAKTKTVPASQAGPVVVFLPGTLASTLIDTSNGEFVWGAEDSLSADPREPLGLRRLSLPLTPVPSAVSAAPDLVRAHDVLRRANERIAGIPVSLAIYEDMLKGFEEAGLGETAPLAVPSSGPSLTAFPYDWRRSIVDAAQSLGATLEARPEGSTKVRLVGHSMGGVVALWYLMHGTASLDSEGALPPVTWAGAEHVDHAILVGAPLRGAAVALRNTIEGNTLAGPLIPTLPPAMIASHPSTFELMPRGDILDGTDRPLMDPTTWRHFGWGLSDTEQRAKIEVLANGADDPMQLADARQAALIARGAAFHRAADRAINPPEGLRLTVIAGTGSASPARIILSEEGSASVGSTEDGDGTVLVSSAVAGFEDASSSPLKSIHIYEVEHTRMMSDPAVFSKVLELLLE
jgi:pimeloyl-ACP methyl ester carboxylesterase